MDYCAFRLFLIILQQTQAQIVFKLLCTSRMVTKNFRDRLSSLEQVWQHCHWICHSSKLPLLMLQHGMLVLDNSVPIELLCRLRNACHKCTVALWGTYMLLMCWRIQDYPSLLPGEREFICKILFFTFIVKLISEALWKLSWLSVCPPRYLYILSWGFFPALCPVPSVSGMVTDFHQHSVPVGLSFSQSR